MRLKQRSQKLFRGWLPRDSVYMHNVGQPRWRRPVWIAVSLIAVIAVAFAVYTGAQTIIRYSNPQADVTASYFEKTVNCTSADVGDVIEVKVLVGWHGYVLPEFERHVEIVDPFPEANFTLIGGNNTLQYGGNGGGEQLRYLLRVVNQNASTLDLPNPQLHLDGVKIPLKQISGAI